jgi:hypothetical protein
MPEHCARHGDAAAQEVLRDAGLEAALRILPVSAQPAERLDLLMAVGPRKERRSGSG